MESQKRSNETIVFFCSDNGAPGRWEQLNSSGGLRGEKGQLYEGGIRIPLIVRWPNRIKPGTSSDTPVSHPDILPTLAELAGAGSSVPQDVTGISLTPELLQTKAMPRDRHFYWEWNGAHFAAYEPKFQAVRRGEWKLVRHASDAPSELYNLPRDPAEANDIAGEHPGVVTELAQWISENRQPHHPQIEPEKPKGKRWR